MQQKYCSKQTRETSRFIGMNYASHGGVGDAKTHPIMIVREVKGELWLLIVPLTPLPKVPPPQDPPPSIQNTPLPQDIPYLPHPQKDSSPSLRLLQMLAAEINCAKASRMIHSSY